MTKVEWHRGELYPRVGFIVTNLARPAERVVAYNQRGTAEQWIKEGKGAIKWTRLSCRTFAANAVRLQLHVLAYNLGNFMRTLAAPKAAEPWSLTSLRKKLIKIGAKVVSHGRYVTFQLAEVAVSRQMFKEILMLIPGCGRRRPQHDGGFGSEGGKKGEVCFDEGKATSSRRRWRATHRFGHLSVSLRTKLVAAEGQKPDCRSLGGWESGECRQKQQRDKMGGGS